MRISKIELRDKLSDLGIKVVKGNYIHKRDIEKLISELSNLENKATGNNGGFEVDAGFKEILKKLGQILLGVIVISQTAFGYQLQKVDKIGALMDKSVKSIAKEYRVDGDYAVKAKEVKKGNIQYVTFSFEKDGKTIATVEFTGTKETKVNDDYNVSTTIKSDDKVAEEVATVLHEILQSPKGL